MGLARKEEYFKVSGSATFGVPGMNFGDLTTGYNRDFYSVSFPRSRK